MKGKDKLQKPGRNRPWRRLFWWVLLCGTWLAFPGQAETQDSSTPTPNASGEIIVLVQANESLWEIAARAGISLAELLAWNDLEAGAVIQPGQPLIIGYGPPPATPTRPITPTPTLPPPPPTRTPQPPPRTAVCILAFTDLNQSGAQEAGEPLASGVAFTIYNDTRVVDNYITNGQNEPHCVENLSPGAYQVTRSVGNDEILTTAGDWAIDLLSGEVVNLAFGSFPSSGLTVVGATPTTAVVSTADDIAPGADRLSRRFSYGLALLFVLIGAGVLFLAGRRIFSPDK